LLDGALLAINRKEELIYFARMPVLEDSLTTTPDAAETDLGKHRHGGEIVNHASSSDLADAKLLPSVLDDRTHRLRSVAVAPVPPTQPVAEVRRAVSFREESDGAEKLAGCGQLDRQVKLTSRFEEGLVSANPMLSIFSKVWVRNSFERRRYPLIVEELGNWFGVFGAKWPEHEACSSESRNERHFSRNLTDRLLQRLVRRRPQHYREREE
jgi:hypothetical protein